MSDFEICGTSSQTTLTPKGNVRIDLKHNQSNQIQSIHSTDKKPELKTEDSCMNVLSAIAEDGNLEESDLSKIDSIAAKYKKDIKNVNKNLQNGEITIFFNKGYEMTIDFYTEAEQKDEKELQSHSKTTLEKATEYVGGKLKKVGLAAWNRFANTMDTFLDRLEQWRRLP